MLIRTSRAEEASKFIQMVKYALAGAEDEPIWLRHRVHRVSHQNVFCSTRR